MANSTKKTPGMLIGSGNLAVKPQDFRVLRRGDRNRGFALSNPYLVSKELKKRGKRLSVNGN